MSDKTERQYTTNADEVNPNKAFKEAGSNAAIETGDDFEQRQKRLVRKIDLRLLPILVSLYVMSFLDRVNIGGAFPPI